MDDKFLQNPDNKPFFRKIEFMNDREVQEMNLFYQHEKLSALKSIKNNLKFFFYLTIASIIIGVLATLK